MKNFNTKPVALTIKKIIKENDATNTYVFEHKLLSKPGQFVMMWIPGVDEKPFSISYDDGVEFWVTVCKVGPATEELFKLKVGDKVGIRGPFGKHYEFKKGEHLALVAGGYGVGPMFFVANEAMNKGCKVEFIIGARTKDLLLFTHKILGLKDVNLHVSTDDGSMGVKGYNTQILEEVLKQVLPAGRHGQDDKIKLDSPIREQARFRGNDNGRGNDTSINHVFACGPERMEKRVGEISEKHGVDCQMAVEKYMKCGFGVCGQCAVDDTGECICKKGTVMNWNYLKKLPEFGVYHRDAQGKKHGF